MRRVFPALCVVLLVVTAGCSGFLGGGDGGTATTTDGSTDVTTQPSPTATATRTGTATETGTATGTPTETATTTETPTATPTETETAGAEDDDTGEEVLGRENGYTVDSEIDVDATDGLNATEFEAAKGRTMARVEVIRGREYRNEISIRFITRETLLDEGLFEFGENDFRDQFWEAAFMIGEDQSSAEALNELYSVVVDGYAAGNEITIVAANPDSPRMDPAVLSHELAHALGGPRPQPDHRILTYDDRVAHRSVFEGNANFVEGEYLERCETEWDCIERPPNASEVQDFEDVNEGLFLWFAAPYTIGPPFMTAQYERNGTSAIDAAYRAVPESTEMFIHPEKFPDDAPTDVEAPDRSSDDWQRLSGPRTRTQEFGEAVLYSALKANDVLGGPEPRINKAQRTGLNYSHPATDGWEGDSFVAYRNGNRTGYVFHSEWETDGDAREFRQAWVELLRSHGGQQVRDGVYRIDSGPFADAFRVRQDGTHVVVVNAPTVEELDGVYDTDG